MILCVKLLSGLSLCGGILYLQKQEQPFCTLSYLVACLEVQIVQVSTQEVKFLWTWVGSQSGEDHAKERNPNIEDQAAYWIMFAFLNLTAKVKSSQMPKSSGTPNLAEQRSNRYSMWCNELVNPTEVPCQNLSTEEPLGHSKLHSCIPLKRKTESEQEQDVLTCTRACNCVCPAYVSLDGSASKPGRPIPQGPSSVCHRHNHKWNIWPCKATNTDQGLELTWETRWDS